MAVLPESMDKLNVQDTAGSLSIIENYIRYMGERIEFSNRNMTKTVSAAGVSSAELYVLVIAMNNSMAAMQSTVNGLTGSVGTLQGQAAALLETTQGLAAGVDALKTAVSGLEQRGNALESRIAALEGRVKTLEDKQTGGST